MYCTTIDAAMKLAAAENKLKLVLIGIGPGASSYL
jgi:hypothetical protein